MLWSALAWGLLAAICASLAVSNGQYQRLPARIEAIPHSTLEARQNARVGQGSYWRSAGIGLGVAVYKADDIALSDIISSCREFADDRQAATGVECFGHVVLFLFKAAAYGWAIHSGVLTVASAYGFRKRDGKATATKLKGLVGGDGLYDPLSVNSSTVVQNGYVLYSKIGQFDVEHHVNETHGSVSITHGLEYQNITKRESYTFKNNAGVKLNYNHNCQNNQVYGDSTTQQEGLEYLPKLCKPLAEDEPNAYGLLMERMRSHLLVGRSCYRDPRYGRH